jgi:hypothetical protein
MMPTMTSTVPMIVAGVAAGAAANAVPNGILPAEWSLPLTCLAGSCLGGVLAIVMVEPKTPRTIRGEGVRWIGATTTATVVGPAACQWLPAVNADNVLALSAFIGFLAWPIMASIQKFGPEWFSEWLDKKRRGGE